MSPSPARQGYAGHQEGYADQGYPAQSYGPASSGSHGVAPAGPRNPVFVRQAQPTPYGFVQQQQQQQQHYNPYGQYADLSAPPPPHSLAPVAVGSERQLASTTMNRSQVLVRERPSLKWGVMIAVSGALLGGVLGLGMDARRQSARAAAAAEARDAAPPVMVATALPQPPVPVALPVAVAVAPAPAPVAPAPAPAPLVSSLAAPAGAFQAAAPAAGAPVVIAPSAGVVVTHARPDPRAAKAPQPPVVRHAAPPVRPTVSFAAKVPQPKPEPVAKAEPPKAEPAKASVKRDASTKAAQDLLEQANKDTTNTL